MDKKEYLKWHKIINSEGIKDCPKDETPVDWSLPQILKKVEVIKAGQGWGMTSYKNVFLQMQKLNEKYK